MSDSIILMILALVVFGPRRLPEIGRQIGKLMFEFRKASNDFKFQMEEELRNAEDADRRRREEAERQRTLAETQKALSQAQNAAEQAMSAAAQAQTAAQTVQSAATPESAYPEDPYDDSQFAETATEPAIPESPSADLNPAEPGLRVQPPSTGEQVAAARPTRFPAEPEASATEHGGSEAAPEEHPAATEPTPHHG